MLKEGLRLSHVPRWSTVDRLKEQSVADHSFRVAIIALNLVDWLIFKGIKEINRGKVVELAILHDIAESHTGDVPTPFKRNIKAIAGATAYQRLFPTGHEGHLYEMDVVKIADVMESITWIERYGINSKYVKQTIAPLLNAHVKEFRERTICEKFVNIDGITAKIREMVAEACNYD